MANDKLIKKEYEILKERLCEIDIDGVKEAIKMFDVEIPSWIFGGFGGGRFGEFSQGGGARNIEEKLDDAAFINKITGAASMVGTHILWDLTKDGKTADMDVAKEVSQMAKSKGVKLGAINPTYFLKGSHRNSLGAMEKKTRDMYIQQTIDGGEIAKKYGSNTLSIWLPDGSMYPGQISLRKTFENVIDSLKQARAKIDDKVQMLIEYKTFEPGTYSTTIVDWGSASLIAKEVGGNSGILIDLGHHFPHCNIEQIVAYAIALKIPAGFHFNTRYAADDDHSAEPNAQYARIFYELANGKVIFNKSASKNWVYTIDQCAGRENRIHAIVHTIDSLMISAARGLIVCDKTLEKRQAEDEIIRANRVFNDATLLTDVRPIVAMARLEKGLNPCPMCEVLDSKYVETIVKERS